MENKVEPWIREIVEEVIGGAPVEVGKRYNHPDEGIIEILSGQYWGTHGLSNFWSWRVIQTGEVKHGYATSAWPLVE
jgi:hypothetical protein